MILWNLLLKALRDRAKFHPNDTVATSGNKHCFTSTLQPKINLSLATHQNSEAANAASDPDRVGFCFYYPDLQAALRQHLRQLQAAGQLNAEIDLNDSTEMATGSSSCYVYCNSPEACRQVCNSINDIVRAVCKGLLAITNEQLASTLNKVPLEAGEIDFSEFEPCHDQDGLTTADGSALSLEATEALRQIKQRRGQELYRKRLEQLWGGRCAVTGIAIPELLRASHAKPWAKCESAEERLSPFNGFLLCTSLDALFDKFLISFADDGQILIAPHLKLSELQLVGINAELHLRKVHPQHLPFLAFHRQCFFALHSATQHQDKASDH